MDSGGGYPEDKELAQRIAGIADDGILSRTVIRLLRQEGCRLGFLPEGNVPLPVIRAPEAEVA